jgi:ABC-type polar amino acid transport system ATPase subunit
MITSAFLESTAAFRPAALRMILAVFAAAAMMTMIMITHFYRFTFKLNTSQYFI